MENKTVKKIDIITKVSKGTGLNVTDSTDLVELFFDIVSDGLVNKKEVKIMGLGTFSIKHKSQRIGRNPKTGEEAVISPRNVVSFKPAKNLKNSLK